MAIPRREFNHKGPFVVRRPFKGEGRQWLVGQPFPARSIGVSVRRLRIMHEQRLIDMLGEEAEQEGREGLQDAALDALTEPEVAEIHEELLVDAEEPAATAPAEPEQPATVEFRATPGERVEVETPSKAKSRRK